MSKHAYRALSVVLSLSFATAAFADEVDWPYYGADQGGTRYTPADQINRDNFDQLRVIWRYRPRDQQIYEMARANRSRDRDRGRGRGDRRRGRSPLWQQSRHTAGRQWRALLRFALQHSRGCGRPNRREVVGVRPGVLEGPFHVLGQFARGELLDRWRN